MLHFEGVGASPGLVMGPVVRLRHVRAGLGRHVGDPRYETALYEAAVHLADEELEALEQKAQEKDRSIFTVQRVMLADEGLGNEVRNYIRAGAGAAAAVDRAAGIFARGLRDSNDAYIAERAADVRDVCQRVVDILDGGVRENVVLTQPSILAAEEIYPTDILTLDRKLLLGFLTSCGAANAHAAIVARTMGIPAVVMLGDACLAQSSGHTAILDGERGEVYFDPDAVTCARFSQRRHLAQRHTRSLYLLRDIPCATRDGTRIRLYANCNSPEQVEEAVRAGAEGVGVLRPDYTLLANRDAAEEEQYIFYKACLLAADGLPVTVSTYDLGMDISAQSLNKMHEANPALGQRGIRYSLAHPPFFLEQLMALLRAAKAGPLRIALPMVATPEDVQRAKAELEKAKAVLRARSDDFCETVPLGILVETPAAALQADALAAHVAFFTVGSDNLAQYAYAADRTSSLTEHYFAPELPAVRKLVLMALQAARTAEIPLCLCGTCASELPLAEIYVRAGVRELSVPAAELPEIKAFLCGIDLETGK